MSPLTETVTVGLPRMHRRQASGGTSCPTSSRCYGGQGRRGVAAEHGIGSGWGSAPRTTPRRGLPRSSTRRAYRRDVVVVLRAGGPLRPPAARGGPRVHAPLPHLARRVRMLATADIDAVSLDLVTDDTGRRLVENLESVAWNGVGAGFDALERTWPPLWSPGRRPVRVTVMGAGRIGRHAVEAATKYGDEARNDAFGRGGSPAVEVVTVGRNLTRDGGYLRERLGTGTSSSTRPSGTTRPSRSCPTRGSRRMPDHAVVCDLVVDPYLLDAEPRVVRGSRASPRGDLDRWELVARRPRLGCGAGVGPHAVRRTVVSCYSWPGVRPEACMRVYGARARRHPRDAGRGRRPRRGPGPTARPTSGRCGGRPPAWLASGAGRPGPRTRRRLRLSRRPGRWAPPPVLSTDGPIAACPAHVGWHPWPMRLTLRRPSISPSRRPSASPRPCSSRSRAPAAVAAAEPDFPTT